MSSVLPIRLVLTAISALMVGALAAPSAAVAVVRGNYPQYVTKAADGDYHWAVSVTLRGADTKDSLCGGTLIAKNRVLTAAHCIDPGGSGQATADAVQVLIGQTSRVATCTAPQCGTTDTARRKGWLLGVREISLHAKADILQVGSDLDHWYYDVAQLTLAEDVHPSLWPAIVEPVASAGEGQTDLTFTSGYAFPATSPTPDAWGAETATADGVDAFVFGWGATSTDGPIENVLLRGGGSMMERLADEECARRYGGASAFRAEDMLCVGRQTYPTRVAPASPDYSPDACQGDSGGPLLKRAPIQDYPIKSNAEAYAWSLETVAGMSPTEIAAAKSQDRASIPATTITAWRTAIRDAISAEELVAWEQQIRDQLATETPQPEDLGAEVTARLSAHVNTEVEARLEIAITAYLDRDLVGTADPGIENRGFLYRERLKAENAQQNDSYDHEGRHWRLLGIVSWGDDCGDPAFPGVYARVGAPEIRQYVTNDRPVPMPHLATGHLGPAAVGVYTPGGTITCQPGGVVDADTFTYAMWRDMNGDGSRSSVDRTLSTKDSVYRVTTDEVSRLTSRDIASGVRIGCIARARGAGGYATISGPVTPIPVDLGIPQLGPETPPAPTPTPTPRDRAAPLLSKRSAVCSKSSCRVSVLIMDAGEPTSGIKTVAAKLTIARKAMCRAKSGRYKGKLRPCTKTIKQTAKATHRGGEEWVVQVKKLRKTDKSKLRFDAVDRAGNTAALTIALKLRKAR